VGYFELVKKYFHGGGVFVAQVNIHIAGLGYGNGAAKNVSGDQHQLKV